MCTTRCTPCAPADSSTVRVPSRSVVRMSSAEYSGRAAAEWTTSWTPAIARSTSARGRIRQGLQVEAVVAEVCDVGVPDRAREEVPVRVDEARGRERRARQRRAARVVVRAHQRLVAVLEELDRVDAGAERAPVILD